MSAPLVRHFASERRCLQRHPTDCGSATLHVDCGRRYLISRVPIRRPRHDDLFALTRSDLSSPLQFWVWIITAAAQLARQVLGHRRDRPLVVHVGPREVASRDERVARRFQQARREELEQIVRTASVRYSWAEEPGYGDSCNDTR